MKSLGQKIYLRVRLCDQKVVGNFIHLTFHQLGVQLGGSYGWIAPGQGGKIGQIFQQLGYFLQAHCDFLKRRNSPKMVTPLVTSLLHFHQCKLFKNMVCILALFGLFWLLFKKLGNCFQIIWSPCSWSNPDGTGGEKIPHKVDKMAN